MEKENPLNQFICVAERSYSELFKVAAKVVKFIKENPRSTNGTISCAIDVEMHVCGSYLKALEEAGFIENVLEKQKEGDTHNHWYLADWLD